MSVLDQRMAALGSANARRISAASFRRELASRAKRDAQLEAARVLREEPASVASMPVHRFLGTVPSIGTAKVREILTRHHIWPLKPVRELTDRQRLVLATEIERRAWL